MTPGGPPSLVRRVWAVVTVAWVMSAALCGFLLFSPWLEQFGPSARMPALMAGWLLCFGGVGGVMAWQLWRLSRWGRAPLAVIERQVRQLAEREYLEVPQPEVAEWVPLARAVNVLVARVRMVLQERDVALDSLMNRLEHDALTGVASREFYVGGLKEELQSGQRGGGLAIVRVHDLDGMNRRVGRNRTDEFLVAMATAMRARIHRWPDADSVVLARLNGADFGLHAPGVDPATWQARMEELAQGFDVLVRDGFSDGDVAWIGATGYLNGETVSDVLTRVDNALLYAQGRRQVVCFMPASARPALVTVAQWRTVIEQALDTGHVALKLQPLPDAHGRPVHEVGAIQLLLPDGQALEADEVLAPAVRSGRISDLDLKLVELALTHIGDEPRRLAVPVSLVSAGRPIFLRQLGELLDRFPERLGLLSLEVPVPAGQAEASHALRALAKLLEPRGCALGLTQFGLHTPVPDLAHAAGLRYVKLAPALFEHPDDPRCRSALRYVWRLLRAHGVEVLAADAVGMRRLAEMLAAAEADATADIGAAGAAGAERVGVTSGAAGPARLAVGALGAPA